MSVLIFFCIALAVGAQASSLGIQTEKASSFAQRAVLMTTETCGYPFISIGDRDVPDLSVWEFDKTARCACIIGIWLLYDQVNYTMSSGAEFDVEFMYGQQNCGPLLAGGVASSIRPVGPKEDFTASSITLYADSWFQAEQEFVEADTPSLALHGRIASLMITGAPGQDDGWTLYQGAGYTQPLVCISIAENDDHAPGPVPDLLQHGIPYTAVASVSRGCPTGVRRVTIPRIGTGHGRFH